MCLAQYTLFLATFGNLALVDKQAVYGLYLCIVIRPLYLCPVGDFFGVAFQ